MEPLSLLVVAIKKEWQPLIADSLTKAGYSFTVTNVDSKRDALQACHKAKFDLVISNCTLPDGDVADLVSVLGKLLPVLVMAEGHCPYNSERALSLLATDFYITSSEQSSWLSAVETALSKWKTNAQRNLNTQQQQHSNLHKKVLARVKEELNDSGIGSVLTLLLEVMDISRIYLCAKNPLSDGNSELVQKSEALAPGIKKISGDKVSQVPYFNRWNTLFSAKQPVQGTYHTLPQKEQQWLYQRDSQSLLAIPIISNNTWKGFIGLEDTLQPREWSMDEIRLLESVAEIIEDRHFRQIPSTYLFENRLVSEHS